ncbi:DUF1372 family protein [Streptococcus sp. S784/96/1]|uniref:DUF1372 family protein n=1 Tax=Streptococcus sp. S784/96/1 TaxID=2653499 RepID=UPI002367A858|nr:DUF1372 family protein [Streptococcus sp. S784/96/1]
MERKLKKYSRLKSWEIYLDMLIFISILTIPLIVLWKMNQIEAKITQPIVYQVDNAGGVMVGTITDKETIDGRYTVTAGAYGKFLVTKEQYESLHVGDEIPDYLKWRGMESNVIKK